MIRGKAEVSSLHQSFSLCISCHACKPTSAKKQGEELKLREEVTSNHSSCPKKSATSGMSCSLKVRGLEARIKKCVQPKEKNALFSFSCNPWLGQLATLYPPEQHSCTPSLNGNGIVGRYSVTMTGASRTDCRKRREMGEG